MLRLRLLSAFALIVAVIGLAWLDYTPPWNLGRPGIWMVPLGIGFLALAVEELRALLAPLSPALSRVVLHGGTQAILLPTFIPAFYVPYPENCPIGRLGFPLIGLSLAVVAAFLYQMRIYRGPGEATLRVALATLAFAFLGVPFAIFVLLRLFHDNAAGMTALLSLIVAVKASDVGAYFAGRFLGRHRLTTFLSPKKTWEGVVGGVVAGALASWAFLAWIAPQVLSDGTPLAGYDWWRCMAYGALLALAGLAGDLAESMIKRDMRMKDSSSLLPGMGGILDVIDSLLAAAPIAYLAWAGGLIGPQA